MDKVKEASSQLHDSLYELPEVIEYLILKHLFENDEELKRLRSNIAHLTAKGKESEKQKAIQEYNEHPLVNNYNLAREEVLSILETIQNILSD